MKLYRNVLFFIFIACFIGCSGSSSPNGAQQNLACGMSDLDWRNEDPNKPVITLIGPHVVHQNLGVEYLDFGAMAFDSEDGDISNQITVLGLEQLDTNTVGDYLVRYRVSSSSGKAADQVTRLVRVNDGTFPVQTARNKNTTGANLGYYEHLPLAYGMSPEEHFPLLIYNHGSGEVGDNLSLLASGNDLVYLFENGQWNNDLPFIVLSAQRCTHSLIDTSALKAFMEYAKKTYRVDQDRIYMAGFSAGGSLVWQYLQTYPQELAAGISMAGVDVVSDVCTFKDVPVWAFHSLDDPNVNIVNSYGVINRLNACDPAPAVAPRLTVYSGYGHLSHTPTLSLSALGEGDYDYTIYDPDIYTWLLGHQREE